MEIVVAYLWLFLAFISIRRMSFTSSPLMHWAPYIIEIIVSKVDNFIDGRPDCLSCLNDVQPH